MIHNIVTEPEKMLHQESLDVIMTKIKSSEIQNFIKDMVETMYAKEGVGLAAIQVGRPIKLCVITKIYNELNKHEDLCLINPTWTKSSRHADWGEEGCLSVPGIYGKIKRYTKIKVKALGKDGQALEFTASGFFARIIQHEIAHLQGHLYIEKAKDLHQVK